MDEQWSRRLLPQLEGVQGNLPGNLFLLSSLQRPPCLGPPHLPTAPTASLLPFPSLPHSKKPVHMSQQTLEKKQARPKLRPTPHSHTNTQTHIYKLCDLSKCLHLCEEAILQGHRTPCRVLSVRTAHTHKRPGRQKGTRLLP